VKRWIRLVLPTCAACLCGTAGADPHPRPVVVELFTSQGCSSCPPADAYLGKLTARSDVLPLVFHVDYWDGLGWRDRFALPQAVERQNVYARNFHRSSVYTPQLVIDGKSDAVGSGGASLERALTNPRDGIPVSVTVREADVLVELGAAPGGPTSDVVLVAFLRHAVSSIGRGENAGRTLEEFNIVRGIRTLGTWRGAAESFHLPVASLPPDATDVAVLVQSYGQAPIVGAAAHGLR
jgi:hypothetical protein